MRGLIKASASVFIGLGAITFVIAGLVAFEAFSEGAASPSANFPAMIGLIVALGGLVAGASVVLVGGTAYLLSSIDERIEGAISKGLRTQSTVLAAAE